MKKYIVCACIGLMFALPAYASTPQEQYVNLLRQLIALYEQQVQSLIAQLNSLSTVTSTSTVSSDVSTTEPVVFGSNVQPLPLNQSPMQDTNVCTLTAESNVGPTSGHINLTWTSNANSAVITSDRIVHQRNVGRPALFGWELTPVTGGTISLPLSDEPGEVNTFTAHFIFNNESKDCTVSVTTQ